MSIAQCMPSELIVHILKYLTHPTDLSSSALTCKSWSLHALELLWYKPNFVQASAWVTFCNVLSETRPTLFPYTHYIRRINLSLLASEVKDCHLTALSVCERLERVTLTNCSNLTDKGIMDFLGTKPRKHLVSVDLSDVTSVTDASIKRIAETCPHLQGLNLSMCKEGLEPFVGVTDSSVIMLAQRCTGLRRVSEGIVVMVVNDFISHHVLNDYIYHPLSHIDQAKQLCQYHRCFSHCPCRKLSSSS